MINPFKNKSQKFEDKKITPLFNVVKDSKNTGIFKLHENYGFIEGTDLYVSKENINNAFNKDLVEYVLLERIFPKKNEKFNYDAKIINVLERHKTEFVGEIIHKEEDKDLVLLDDPKLNKVAFTNKTEFPVGEKVKVKLKIFELDNLHGEIQKNLGHKDEINIDVFSILEDYKINTNFPEKAQQEAKTINLNIEERKKDPKRQDSTHIPYVTIDPNSSKDFDDAIAVQKEKSIYRLNVAIADVWSYIKDKKEIQKEAEKRATSIYFLNSVIPMLPDELSTNICSLVPNEYRCAISFSVDIDFKGNVLWETTKIIPTIIKSKRRFTYEEVNKFFENNDEFKEEEKEIIESLKNGFELYKLLDVKRKEKGFITIEIPELKINLNEKGEVINTYLYQRGDAQMMIENFMVLANEGVARFCQNNCIPALYRIHEAPETNKILSFMEDAKRWGFEIKNKTFTKITQKLINDWFSENQKNQNLDQVSTLLLKSMQKAKYSINNFGHFGLNLKNYLHFTSPIRRYPDTIVHRMLWTYVFEEKKIGKSPDNELNKKLNFWAQNSTEKEIIASEVSKQIEDSKLIKYTNKQLDKVFKGKVISITNSGAFIKINCLHIERFIKSKVPLNVGANVLASPIHNKKEFKLIKVL